MAMAAKTRAIFDFLKEVGPETKVTAEDIAKSIGYEVFADSLEKAVKSVNGAVTQGLQKQGLSQRKEAEITLADGSHKKVKFISLTEKGMSFDPDAPVEE